MASKTLKNAFKGYSVAPLGAGGLFGALIGIFSPGSIPDFQNMLAQVPVYGKLNAGIAPKISAVLGKQLKITSTTKKKKTKSTKKSKTAKKKR